MNWSDLSTKERWQLYKNRQKGQSYSDLMSEYTGQLSYEGFQKKYNKDYRDQTYDLGQAYDIYKEDPASFDTGDNAFAKLKPDGWHFGTVNPKTGEFLKRKDHPTLQKELDWYNSNDASEFRGSHSLDKSGDFYKYVEAYEDGGIPSSYAYAKAANKDINAPEFKQEYADFIERIPEMAASKRERDEFYKRDKERHDKYWGLFGKHNLNEAKKLGKGLAKTFGTAALAAASATTIHASIGSWSGLGQATLAGALGDQAYSLATEDRPATLNELGVSATIGAALPILGRGLGGWFNKVANVAESGLLKSSHKVQGELFNISDMRQDLVKKKENELSQTASDFLTTVSIVNRKRMAERILKNNPNLDHTTRVILENRINDDYIPNIRFATDEALQKLTNSSKLGDVVGAAHVIKDIPTRSAKLKQYVSSNKRYNPQLEVNAIHEAEHGLRQSSKLFSDNLFNPMDGLSYENILGITNAEEKLLWKAYPYVDAIEASATNAELQYTLINKFGYNAENLNKVKDRDLLEALAHTKSGYLRDSFKALKILKKEDFYKHKFMIKNIKRALVSMGTLPPLFNQELQKGKENE